MNTTIYILLLATIPGSGTSVRSECHTVPESWLDRTAMLESSNRDSAVERNRHGRIISRGRYQLSKAAWTDFGGKQPWRQWAHDPRESRRIASIVLIHCARACRRDHKPVTFTNARWYYRHGWGR